MSEQAVDITSGTIAGSVRPFDRFVESLKRQADADSTTRAYDVTASQVDKIIKAESAEDILSADMDGVVSGKDITDTELRLRDYTVGKASEKYKSDLEVYVLMDCINLQTGEEVIVNCGAPLVVAKVVALKANGHLPIDIVLKGTEVQSGGVLLRMQAAPKRAIQATSVE